MAKHKARFENAEFVMTNVELWTPELHDGQGFRCSRGEFVTFFKHRIAREVEALICRCWILQDEGYLAGYVTLFADKLSFEEQHLIGDDIKYKAFPAVKIGQLATDTRAKGKGAGTCLVEWSINYVISELIPMLGVRFVSVDALYDPDTGYDSSSFYEKFGFMFASPDEELPPPIGYRTMYLDLKPIIEVLNQPQSDNS